MSSFRDNIRKVVPYVPGEQPKVEGKLIKLNTNENPYPPAPAAAVAARNMDSDKFRLYPDPTANMLVSAIAKFHGVNENQVFVGVGSDDVIAMAFLTFFNSDKPVLFPDITYSFYDVWADLFKIPYVRPELDKDYNIVKSDYLVPNGGIIFPNPNAPTGVAVGVDFIEDIVKANQDSVVIIDEAYVDFGCESAISLVDKYENLLITRTFSKSRSMAGLRIGYAVGSAELIKAINDVKYSYNSYTMNMAALEIGTSILEDVAYFEDTTKKIIATRERSKKELAALGFTFPDSKTNFIFAKPDKMSAKELFEELKKRNIYVRYFSSPKVCDSLRITIGTDEEMDSLFAAIREIYSKF